jgi:hypothetical protein
VHRRRRGNPRRPAEVVDVKLEELQSAPKRLFPFAAPEERVGVLAVGGSGGAVGSGWGAGAGGERGKRCTPSPPPARERRGRGEMTPSGDDALFAST